ncbi:MAG: hypothetical protein ACRYFX_24110 [Janthinobacterium lividum]
MPLQNLIPHNLAYLFRDLYEAHWSGDNASLELEALADSHAAIVAALHAKYGSYKQVERIVHAIEIAGQALPRLEQMVEADSIKGNHDAKVFLDALNEYFDDIQVELSKLDALARL